MKNDNKAQVIKPSDSELTPGHPVAVGVGAAGAGIAGGIAGAVVAGPIGAIAGAAIGAVIGGVAGHEVAADIDPVTEDEFWRANHTLTPYYSSMYTYDEYEPAYRYGWESYSRRNGPDTTFETIEADLGHGWMKAKGASRLGWDHAKQATKDAWTRVKATAHTATAPNPTHELKPTTVPISTNAPGAKVAP